MKRDGYNAQSPPFERHALNVVVLLPALKLQVEIQQWFSQNLAPVLVRGLSRTKRGDVSRGSQAHWASTLTSAENDQMSVLPMIFRVTRRPNFMMGYSTRDLPGWRSSHAMHLPSQPLCCAIADRRTTQSLP